MPAMPRRSQSSSVARRIGLLQLLMGFLLVVTAGGLAVLDARADSRERALVRVTHVGRTVADSPATRAALQAADPTAPLQPYTEEVRRHTDVDFIVVMAPDRTRFTHPVPARIGERFIGDLGGALQGRVFTQEYTGTLGPSVRTVVPVLVRGRVIGMVSVGITIDRIDQQLWPDLEIVAVAALLLLGVALCGTWLITRQLRRQTYGMDPDEITRMYEYYRAVLHAVREGLVLIDSERRVQLVNDEARRLLELPPDDAVIGRPVASLGLPAALVAALLADDTDEDEVYVTGGQVLVVSNGPAYWEGREVGSVVTLRDRTELRSVVGELDAVRGLTESLRSAQHEAANRLHTVVSLIEMERPEEALEFATAELDSSQRLADELLTAVGEPVLAALLLGKAATANERGIELRVTGDVGAQPVHVEPRDLVTVVGNLVDNAMDAVAGQPERIVELHVSHDSAWFEVRVGDSGPGVDAEVAQRIFERGWSSKVADENGAARGLGLALVSQVARRHGGGVTIGTAHLGGAELTARLGSARPGSTQ